jgi:DMSO reductase anchor subunit
MSIMMIPILLLCLLITSLVLLRMKMRITKAIVTIMIVGIMIGQAMPMTFMIDSFDPWYMPYTTIWFIISTLIFYPATAIATLVLRQPIHGVVHWLANVAYAALLTWLIWKAKSPKKIRNETITGEQNQASDCTA